MATERVAIGKQYLLDVVNYASFYQQETGQTTVFPMSDVVTVEDVDKWEDWGDVAMVRSSTRAIVSWLPARFLVPMAASQ